MNIISSFYHLQTTTISGHTSGKRTKLNKIKTIFSFVCQHKSNCSFKSLRLVNSVNSKPTQQQSQRTNALLSGLPANWQIFTLKLYKPQLAIEWRGKNLDFKINQCNFLLFFVCALLKRNPIGKYNAIFFWPRK